MNIHTLAPSPPSPPTLDAYVTAGQVQLLQGGGPGAQEGGERLRSSRAQASWDSLGGHVKPDGGGTKSQKEQSRLNGQLGRDQERKRHRLRNTSTAWKGRTDAKVRAVM
jgi:hypothetical protein